MILHRLPLALSISAISAVVCATAPFAEADVKLPSIISDNMVLLQGGPATVWGWASPNEKVTVKFGDKTASAVADAEGKWKAKLDEIKAAETGELTISGNNSITLKNVAVGEVWVCSGQSNMEWKVSGAANPQQEAAAADFPGIRMFTVKRAPADLPQEHCEGQWIVCSPQTAANFSAVGYYFGREVHKEIKQPVGLIHTSWGGTPAEYWTPEDVLKTEFPGFDESWEKAKADLPKAKEKHAKDMEEWKVKAEEAKAKGAQPPRQPEAPRGSSDFKSPGCLYNGMVAPIVNYNIRGAIWYQGESNAGNPKQYKTLFPTMIKAWREKFASGEFPFLFVQLANYMARHEQPTDSNWARLREAQTQTLQLPHTGMAVAIDIGEEKDIHPKNKQEVGRRLALSALATVYFKDREFSGPLYAGAQEEEGRIRLSFRHAEGLKAKDGGELKGFAIAGDDKKFVWAKAEIQGDHIIVSSPDVKEPKAVRYAWADNPECNLINGADLPASPFRTDDWEMNAK